jgi:regulatory protein YycI of two-component signal transduction system YycFG
LRKSDYKTSHDLEFESYATAVERVLQLMQSCGLPELKVKTVYALDLETMRKHYEDYANSDAGDIPEFTLSEDDECYLMHFRQIVDGIPLTDSVWEKATRTWDVTESPIIAVYSENGLESFYSRGLYQIETAYQESPLITPLQAAQTLADDYASGIILTETEVSSVELNYVAVYENEDIVLVPAWMFVVSSRSKTPDTIDYRFGVVDAITGKLIRTAVDNK